MLVELTNLLNPLNYLVFLFTTFPAVEKCICLYLSLLIIFVRYDTIHAS